MKTGLQNSQCHCQIKLEKNNNHKAAVDNQLMQRKIQLEFTLHFLPSSAVPCSLWIRGFPRSCRTFTAHCGFMMTAAPWLSAHGPFADCCGINGWRWAAALAPPSAQWVAGLAAVASLTPARLRFHAKIANEWRSPSRNLRSCGSALCCLPWCLYAYFLTVFFTSAPKDSTCAAPNINKMLWFECC